MSTDQEVAPAVATDPQLLLLQQIADSVTNLKGQQNKFQQEVREEQRALREEIAEAQAEHGLLSGKKRKAVDGTKAKRFELASASTSKSLIGKGALFKALSAPNFLTALQNSLDSIEDETETVQLDFLLNVAANFANTLDALASYKRLPEMAAFISKLRSRTAEDLMESDTIYSSDDFTTLFDSIEDVDDHLCGRCGRKGHTAGECRFFDHATKKNADGQKLLLIDRQYLVLGKGQKCGKWHLPEFSASFQ